MRTRIKFRPPGYRRGRQASYNAWYWLSAWRTFTSAGRAAPGFQATLSALRERGLLYEPKLPRYWQLHQLAEAAVAPETAIAELGVYRGATARILAEVARRSAPDAELHLFDTFAGMPSSGTYDYSGEQYSPGDLADVDETEVRRLLAGSGIETVFWVGPFAETLPRTRDVPTLSLTHVDADLYDSVREACEWAYPRTRRAGLIVFDDYADPDCPGATKAVDEFFATLPESPVLLPTGQALVVKQTEPKA